jgi:hypothetical protein
MAGGTTASPISPTLPRLSILGGASSICAGTSIAVPAATLLIRRDRRPAEWSAIAATYLSSLGQSSSSSYASPSAASRATLCLRSRLIFYHCEQSFSCVGALMPVPVTRDIIHERHLAAGWRCCLWMQQSLSPGQFPADQHRQAFLTGAVVLHAAVRLPHTHTCAMGDRSCITCAAAPASPCY